MKENHFLALIMVLCAIAIAVIIHDVRKQDEMPLTVDSFPNHSEITIQTMER